MKTHHSSATSSFSRPKLFCAIVAVMTLASQAHAGPSGGQVVDGLGSISNVGKETTILQDSHRLAINWDSFNIAADERVEFIQPGSQSLALNRIIGNDGSQILGRLDANGHVILVNPNGIIFGENATVNVGGLVASGLDIKPTDFMNGDLVFKQRGNKEGLVINQGLINAASGGGEWPGGSHGNVVLLGKRVANEGLISATLGSVTLAAGKEAVLTFDPRGLIGVRVSKEILQEEIGLDAAVSNSGQINAEGGRVAAEGRMPGVKKGGSSRICVGLTDHARAAAAGAPPRSSHPRRPAQRLWTYPPGDEAIAAASSRKDIFCTGVAGNLVPCVGSAARISPWVGRAVACGVGQEQESLGRPARVRRVRHPQVIRSPACDSNCRSWPCLRPRNHEPAQPFPVSTALPRAGKGFAFPAAALPAEGLRSRAWHAPTTIQPDSSKAEGTSAKRTIS